jgi:hypothetical protein
MSDSETREYLMQKTVEEAVSYLYEKLSGGDFTTAESGLMWLQVMDKMFQSLVIDQQSKVTREMLGLKP